MVDEMAEVDLVLELIGASAQGDVFRSGALLQALVEGRPTGDLYPVCCGVASAGRDLLEKMAGKVGGDWFWGLLPGSGSSHAPVLTAQRFVVAFANGDTETCLALYRAAESASEQDKYDLVVCTVICVGGLLNAAIERKAAGMLPD